MSAKRVSGERVTGGASDQTLYIGPGRLVGFLISHAQTSAQSVTFKDGTNTILVVRVAPGACPAMVNLGMGDKDKLDGIEFVTSLVVNAGVNSEVNVWYLGY